MDVDDYADIHAGKITTDDALVIGTVAAAGEDTDKFLVLDSSGNVDYRTGTQVLSDIGGSGSDTTYSAGTLLDLSGTTFNVDLTEAGEAAIANGDYLLFLDGGATGTHAKEAVADVATLFAGTGLTASSSVINIDAAQTGINSLLATDIVIGEDAQTKIDFETANEIHFDADNAERVKIDSTGLNIVSGSLETATIDYTDGDLSMTIADGGKVTFAAGFEVGSDAAGDILYHNGTSYVRLAKGTADQVLTMNDGATAPNWETAGGGGAWTLIHTEAFDDDDDDLPDTGTLKYIQFGSGGGIHFDNSTYVDYVFMIENAVSDVDDTHLVAQVAKTDGSGGLTWDTGNNYHQASSANGYAIVALGTGSAANEQFYGDFWLYAPGNSTYTHMRAQGVNRTYDNGKVYFAGGSNHGGGQTAVVHEDAAAVIAIRFYFANASAVWEAGNIRMYGIKRS